VDELIETDVHQPYLDGVNPHIDRGAHPAGAVPLRPVRPSPPVAVLLGIPLGQLCGSGPPQRADCSTGRKAAPRERTGGNPGDRLLRPLRQTGADASRYVIMNRFRLAARGAGLRSASATLKRPSRSRFPFVPVPRALR
jgi:hypothetical protein